MASHDFTATIQTSIRSSGFGSSENILDNVEKIRKSVDSLREVNLELERMRDQYIIHLQQCQEDHEILRNLYKNLRLKMDKDFSNFQPTNESPIIEPKSNSIIKTENSIIITSRFEKIDLNPKFEINKIDVQLKHSISVDGHIVSITYNNNSTKIAFSNGLYVFIINPQDGTLIQKFELSIPNNQSEYHSRSIVFSPNDKYLAVSISPEKIALFDLNQNIFLKFLNGHTNIVSSLFFTEDNTKLISTSFDSLLIIWDLNTFEKINIISHDTDAQAGSITSMSAKLDPSFYILGFSSGFIGVHSPGFEEPIMKFTGNNQNSPILNVCVSPKDETVATSGPDNSILIWKIIPLPKKINSLNGHQDLVLNIKFSYNLPILISSSKDKTIRIWNTQKSELLSIIHAHDNSVFGISHHNNLNQFVSSGGDGNVCIWEYKLN